MSWINRIASLAVVLVYLVLALRSDPAQRSTALLFVVLGVLWAMPLIWFPATFGNYIGMTRHGYIDQKSPAVLVAMMGWFFLVGLPAIMYYITRTQ